MNANTFTNEELRRIEKRLTEIYSRASKEIGEKTEKYFARFKVLDEKKRALVKAGEMSESAYKDWLSQKVFVGEHWKTMQKEIVARLYQADRDAMAYVNGKLPEIYVANYNEVAEGFSALIKGTSFELTNLSSVRTLATKDKTLLPYKLIDGKKVERWHTARVNAEVVQGIVQGESVQQVAKRLRDNVGMTAKGSAIRNARTAVNSARNKGKYDMMVDGEEKGVISKKVWVAIHDERTRDAHLELDGEMADLDEYFENSIGKILYPHDPDADPANVYNCRCGFETRVVGFVNPETGKFREINRNIGGDD